MTHGSGDDVGRVFIFSRILEVNKRIKQQVVST